MTKSQIKLDFLLDLFDAEYTKSYVSVIELFNDHGSNLTRIEVILQNVGRLCLYQNFIELDGGEQVPYFTVFYSDSIHKNIRTKITSVNSLNYAIKVVYKSKKYMENNPSGRIVSSDDLIKRTKKNKELADKLYKKQLAKRIPFFQMIYREK